MANLIGFKTTLSEPNRQSFDTFYLVGSKSKEYLVFLHQDKMDSLLLQISNLHLPIGGLKSLSSSDCVYVNLSGWSINNLFDLYLFTDGEYPKAEELVEFSSFVHRFRKAYQHFSACNLNLNFCKTGISVSIVFETQTYESYRPTGPVKTKTLELRLGGYEIDQSGTMIYRYPDGHFYFKIPEEKV